MRTSKRSNAIGGLGPFGPLPQHSGEIVIISTRRNIVIRRNSCRLVHFGYVGTTPFAHPKVRAPLYHCFNAPVKALFRYFTTPNKKKKFTHPPHTHLTEVSRKSLRVDRSLIDAPPLAARCGSHRWAVTSAARRACQAADSRRERATGLAGATPPRLSPLLSGSIAQGQRQQT